MTVGDPKIVSNQHVGLRYQCVQSGFNRGPEMANFPTSPCPAGIFVTQHFPA